MDLLLDYLEKGGSLADLRLARPMSEIRRVCHDLSGRTPLELADGRTITPIDLQTEHLARVRAHTADLDLSELHRRALDLWERGLDAVARGRPQDVAADLDWAAKHQLLTRYARRAGTGLDDPRVARLALAYHDVDPGTGLRPKLERAGLLHRLVDEDRCRAAVDTPPATTRARLRGAAVALAQDLRRDLTVDWVNLRLDDGRTPPLALRDPFACADERVDALLDAMTRQDAPAPSWPPTI